jgi:hypothetical protein
VIFGSSIGETGQGCNLLPGGWGGDPLSRYPKNLIPRQRIPLPQRRPDGHGGFAVLETRIIDRFPTISQQVTILHGAG